ncbi:hypothetical protein PybrP1_000227 [[Pythium] brassicae (nom. inval.)]|nr:hypothetical protein PybrP1_000227 [[Pythium] brassicae (nom. inval.)]
MAATRLRVSVISELKEFSVKDADEDKARTWLNKVKSAGRRDQATQGEMCLVLGDLLMGPAQNCSRSLCDDTADRREHVNHFVDTIDDPEVATHLVSLQLDDAKVLEEAICARQRLSDRERKETHGSPKNRTRPPANKRRSVNVVRAPPVASKLSGLPSNETSSDADKISKVYLAAQVADEPAAKILVNRNIDDLTNRANDDAGERCCTHCGFSRHTDLSCWRRLICAKCGKRGHPTDRCLHVCNACGDIYGAGSCKMEEFFNFFRQWYVPQRHAGILPPQVEKALN